MDYQDQDEGEENHELDLSLVNHRRLKQYENDVNEKSKVKVCCNSNEYLNMDLSTHFNYKGSCIRSVVFDQHGEYRRYLYQTIFL